ncbi:TrmH family RNA methyltransferase [Nocardioides aurantiacus]|uniref:TrmH family RNA methyltransferase n=1 Tax=Nocardioides aurantiacus TaxID=86796 RepID=A0A3N2CUR1_9ACTN|nr:RNA methyltransferase [Nocardioides aurantiacus]ROR91213.1 TrmH family RNA methyltransferase [Nocardioides aurantiacus]
MASFQPDRALARSSGRVKAARKLARRASRAEHGLFLAEGEKALTEALQRDPRGPGGVAEVFATPAVSEALAPLRSVAEAAGVRWLQADEDAVASLSGAVSPQGVVAVCRVLDVGLDEVVATSGTVVLCADVRDPGNAGTVVRTADAAGATGVVLAGSSVDPYNDKTVRATVGSLWHLPLALEPDPAAAVARLQASGRLVLAADGGGETDLFDAEDAGLLDHPVAWLLGNEAWGLPDDLAALADHRVAIPILGRAESLNLATAAAVCLYASARRA